jgi:hypothetical protein
MNKHKSPMETIKAHCHQCVNSRSETEVKNCTGDLVYATGKPCPFYPHRNGGRRPKIKVMRIFCLECMGGSREAVNECSTADCLIYPFRFGKNPALAGKGATAEQMSLINPSLRGMGRIKSVQI